MKTKVLFVLVALLSVPLFSSGQAAILALIFGDRVATEKFNVSLELGVPANFISGVDDSKAKLGINFGIAGNIKLSQNWFLSPTAYFLSKRNFGIENVSLNTDDPFLNSLYVDVPSKVTLNYTDVHLLLTFRPNNSNFRFGISPQISFLGAAMNDYIGDFGAFELGINEYTNSIDYGVIGSVGYFIKTGNCGNGIQFSLRYYQGFTDVFTDDYMTGNNRNSYFAAFMSLPFITDELAEQNLKSKELK